MWKIKIYPIWNLSKLENWLIEMESKGLKLEKWCCLFFFYFILSKPKKVTYAVLYSFLKEFGMSETKEQLKSQYNADPIGNSYGTVSIYRICDMSFRIESIEYVRLQYIKHVIVTKMLMSMMLGLPFQFCVMLDLISNGCEGAGNLYLIILFVVCAIPCFYYLFGLRKVMKDLRKIVG